MSGASVAARWYDVSSRFGAPRNGCAAAARAAAAARLRHPFVAPGVAVDATLRSAALSFVS